MERRSRKPGMLKRNETAHFDLLSWFEGESLAEGVFEDRKGRVKRRFHVEMIGRPTPEGLILEERFFFDDGERQERTWHLTRGDGLTFSGTCHDAVSRAAGHFAPGAAYLTSELRLAVGSRRIAMRFDDVFYDAGKGMMLNRSTVSKWGIRLGQVLILFRKPLQLSP